MIIYGYRNREVQEGSGNFHCPNCRAQRQYRRVKIKRYFTLFFIPLFPFSTLSEYVECMVCRRTYKPEILAMSIDVGNASTTDPFNGSTSPSFLQSVSGNQNQPAPPPKKNSCLPWAVLAIAFVFLAFSCLMGVAITAAQSEGSVDSSTASYILAILMCPGPFFLLGVIAAGGGIFLLRTQQENSQNLNEP